MLCHNNRAFLSDSAQVAIGDVLRRNQVIEVIGVQTSMVSPELNIIRDQVYQTKIDGPWIALIVIAGMIILFCFVGLIVICYTWSR